MVSKYSWLNWFPENAMDRELQQELNKKPEKKPYEGEPSNDLDNALHPILKGLDGIGKVSANHPPEIGMYWATNSSWQGFVVNGVRMQGLTPRFQNYWIQKLTGLTHQKYLKTREEKALKAISQYKSVNGLSHLS